MDKSTFKSRVHRHLPNAITFTRIFLALIAIILLLINIYKPDEAGYVINIKNEFMSYVSGYQIAAAIIFVFASSTDWLDGYLARKFHTVTNLGKIIDPIADKILINGVGVLLAINHSLLVYLLVINLLRDILLDAVRIYAASKNIIIHASIFGKIKTFLLIAGFTLVFFTLGHISNSQHWFVYVMNLLNFIAVFFSVYSAIVYLINFKKANKRSRIN
ncbi:CDP-diacylglycerol--glycerol-3-phosphate 3-phosphatidyltransferase [Ureaplasma miroungigenitalium]|uniref:CDP-diacylglycerol--glycerol-3-phosphate 3-phosphatidyltransferase n=1 Tax=Ureaplasma miroungigenitalium TaxID=1042321 RepID=UPI0021E72EA8|nr:CDP-diacylglycerol--glycerol-3-phosphate 3-phosphatidyltransferase [Ureaplasma miroungigenitalium]MCV3734511.1 CDP-diacylglycerol--glycerol-3-phosphate 3-phosphatidyltransferase [Ureaplasma miroungigenitalium]